MRRFPSILILAALTAAPLHGQSVGLHAGASMSTMNVDDLDDPRFAPTAGLSADIGFGGLMGLSVRGSYVRKGAKGELNIASVPVTFATEADYGEVSVLLTARAGNTPLRLMVGPSAAFVLTCTFSYTYAGEGGGTKVSDSSDCEDQADVASIDYGVTGGVGVVVGDRIRYTLDAFYTMGLTDAITDEQGADPGKHGVAMVMVGVSFPLAGR
jgi:hypothetical protein